jgi:alkylation response protein AidB-like acyl-CoA dehydrogenase
MLRDMVRQMADKELAPNAGTWDREHTFPQTGVDKLIELGLMGVAIDPEHGGTGMDYLVSHVLLLLDHMLVCHEAPHGCTTNSVVSSKKQRIV